MTLVMAPRCHAEKVLLGHHDNDNFLVTLVAVPHGRWAGQGLRWPHLWLCNLATLQFSTSDQPTAWPVTPPLTPPLAGPILHLESLKDLLTCLSMNYSAWDASILKISVPFIKRRSWGFGTSKKTMFWLPYSNLQSSIFKLQSWETFIKLL